MAGFFKGLKNLPALDAFFRLRYNEKTHKNTRNSAMMWKIHRR